MSHTNNDDKSNGTVSSSSQNDRVDQTGQEKVSTSFEELSAQPSLPGGRETVTLRPDGYIELVMYCITPDAFFDGTSKYEPGTPGYEELLKRHGPLEVGKPHSIPIRMDAKQSSERDHNQADS